MDHGIYQKCISMIDNYYNHDIFLLRQGDLETYLGMHDKGLEETVRFCTRHFKQWIHDLHFEEHRKEITNILHHILCEEKTSKHIYTTHTHHRR